LRLGLECDFLNAGLSSVEYPVDCILNVTFT